MDIELEIVSRIALFINLVMNVPPEGQYVLWDNKIFDLTQFNNMSGSLIINNPEISLNLSSPLYDGTEITSTELFPNESIKVCIDKLEFSKIDFTFDYIADIGINDAIPIYGSGSYKGSWSNVATTFCWLFNSSINEILDFHISLNFHHQPATFTGFYNNAELNPILSNILTLIKRILAMWNNYEPDCMRTCIWNPIFLFLTNYLAFGLDKSSEFSVDNCKCLLDTTKNFEETFNESEFIHNFVKDLIERRTQEEDWTNIMNKLIQN